MSAGLTICDECGAVEEADEMQECILRGVDALMCLRCVASLWPWMVPACSGEGPKP